MSPLRVVTSENMKVLPKGGGNFQNIKDRVLVVYDGDNEGSVRIYVPDETNPYSFTLPNVGTKTEVEYTLLLKDFDGNLGPVQRSIKLERI